MPPDRNGEAHLSSSPPPGTTSDRGLRPADPESALPDPREADDVLYDPSPDWLREFSKQLETTAEFGSLAHVSEQRSRCANRAKNAVDALDVTDFGHVETGRTSGSRSPSPSPGSRPVGASSGLMTRRRA